MQPHRASVSPFALHVRLKVTGCAWLGLARQIIALNISYVAQFSLKTCSRLPPLPLPVCVHVSLMTVWQNRRMTQMSFHSGNCYCGYTRTRTRTRTHSRSQSISQGDPIILKNFKIVLQSDKPINPLRCPKVFPLGSTNYQSIGPRISSPILSVRFAESSYFVILLFPLCLSTHNRFVYALIW